MNGRGLAYQGLKWRAMGWLVLGRLAPAEALFDEMLRRWPSDGYALSSRSHVRSRARGRCCRDRRSTLPASWTSSSARR